MHTSHLDILVEESPKSLVNLSGVIVYKARRFFRISLFLTCTNRNSRQLTLLLTEGKEVIPRRTNKKNPKIPKAK